MNFIRQPKKISKTLERFYDFTETNKSFFERRGKYKMNICIFKNVLFINLS